MPTTADYLGDLVNLRKELASNLACNGAVVKATEDETFSTLIPKALEVLEQYNIITDNGTKFNDMFYDHSKQTESPVKQYYTEKCTDFRNMFYACQSLKNIGAINTSNGIYFDNMFAYCKQLTEIKGLDTSNGVSFDKMFYQAVSLKTIDPLDLTNASSLPGGVLGQCWALTNLRILGVIKCTITLVDNRSLSNDSAKSVISALANYSNTSDSGKHTCKFHATVKNNLIAEGNTSPNNNTWLEYVTDKGWLVG